VGCFAPFQDVSILYEVVKKQAYSELSSFFKKSSEWLIHPPPGWSKLPHPSMAACKLTHQFSLTSLVSPFVKIDLHRMSYFFHHCHTTDDFPLRILLSGHHHDYISRSLLWQYMADRRSGPFCLPALWSLFHHAMIFFFKLASCLVQIDCYQIDLTIN
jgi:hypothetical protein